MIKALYRKALPELVVQGHAGYGELGKDVVCAGASTLVFTLCHELLRLGLEHERELRGGYARLGTQGQGRELFEFVVSGFMVLAESYPECVEVLMRLFLFRPRKLSVTSLLLLATFTRGRLGIFPHL